MTPRRQRRHVLPLLLLNLTVLAGGRAAAQQTFAPQDQNFSPQLFHPAVGPDEFLGVEPAVPLHHLNYSLGLWLNYSRGSFAISNITCDPGGGNCKVGKGGGTPVKDLLGADLVFSIGFLERLQLGMGVPMSLYQNGDDALVANDDTVYALRRPSAFALGDPWIDLKVRLWGRDRGPSIALAGFINIPASLATPNNFGGGSNVSGGGKALAGWEAERWRVGLSFGVLARPSSSFAHYASSVVGDQLVYGGAFAFNVLAQRKLTLVAELSGRADFSGSHFNNLDANPLELDVAAKLKLTRSLYFTVGVGTGIIKGLGAPLIRGFAGLTFSPDRRDRDKDGIPDSEDKCPDQPEDKDGFQDDDGCPDPDNDGDQIPDVKDKCPNEAEDYDGFQDEDGCPEYDNDKDGIPDIKDNCPLDPEDHLGPKPMDGCPLDKTDSDGDGIPDNKDKCPLDPEDKDGFEDEDGCPNVDNDEDGIPDAEDKCPNAAEDFDGFQDDDGCPDPDNDGDGIPDKQDKCPNEPETINGYMDEDGCPDKGPPSKVMIVGQELVILEKVFFATDKASILPKSFNVLDQVASTLKAHADIKKVQIEGHTDSQGGAAKNRKLSQERADSVLEYLAMRGVGAERLVAKGFGPDRPVADNKTARGREANRRVEFHILEQAGKDAPAGESGEAAPTEETPSPGVKPGAQSESAAPAPAAPAPAATATPATGTPPAAPAPTAAPSQPEPAQPAVRTRHRRRR